MIFLHHISYAPTTICAGNVKIDLVLYESRYLLSIIIRAVKESMEALPQIHGRFVEPAGKEFEGNIDAKFLSNGLKVHGQHAARDYMYSFWFVHNFAR